ncbi:MAG: MscS Mechanosensitive ion channel [Ignavibacteriaceae bacterium]|nr:MscS Mechanosensitive ion channel [Ignavibacteriaceae bacterium]
MQEFLNQTFWGNTVQSYLIAAGIFIGASLIIFIFRKVVISRLRRWAESTETKLDDLLIRGLQKSIIPVLNILVFYFAVKTLSLHPKVERAVDIISVILITYFIIKMITAALRFGLDSYIKSKSTEEEEAQRRIKQMRGITAIVSFFIWVLGFIFLLDNLGFEITTVIAGLGIGGIAIALAAQAVLGDLFSYFVIFFDRPFEIGDFIVIGEFRGNIEHIGIKTTRVRSLSGEQLVFGNSDLTSSRIQNFKRMDRRRVVFKLGVTYQTPADKIEQAIKIVEQIIIDHPDVTYDRGHFATFGAFSLDLEFVYFVLSNDYNQYMNIQQDVNFRVLREFEKLGVAFSYPTQTLFVNKTEKA